MFGPLNIPPDLAAECRDLKVPPGCETPSQGRAPTSLQPRGTYCLKCRTAAVPAASWASQLVGSPAAAAATTGLEGRGCMRATCHPRRHVIKNLQLAAPSVTKTVVYWQGSNRSICARCRASKPRPCYLQTVQYDDTASTYWRLEPGPLRRY